MAPGVAASTVQEPSPARAAPPSALSTALAALHRLAPALPTSSSPAAPTSAPNPLELLWVDLLARKGPALSWPDVRAVCALLPLAAPGGPEDAGEREGWERWLSRAAVKGVLRVVEGLKERESTAKEGDEVALWVGGLAAVLRRKAGGELGEGKARETVDGSPTSPIKLEAPTRGTEYANAIIHPTAEPAAEKRVFDRAHPDYASVASLPSPRSASPPHSSYLEQDEHLDLYRVLDGPAADLLPGHAPLAPWRQNNDPRVRAADTLGAESPDSASTFATATEPSLAFEAMAALRGSSGGERKPCIGIGEEQVDGCGGTPGGDNAFAFFGAGGRDEHDGDEGQGQADELPMSNQLALAQQQERPGAPSPSSGAQKPVGPSVDGEDAGSDEDWDEEATRARRAKEKGKARAVSRSISPPAPGVGPLACTDDAPLPPAAQDSALGVAADGPDGLRKVNTAGFASAPVQATKPRARTKPVMPALPVKPNRGKAQMGLLARHQEGEDELVSSEGDAAAGAPAPASKKLGAKRKKPKRPAFEDEGENQLASTADEADAPPPGRARATVTQAGKRKPAAPLVKRVMPTVKKDGGSRRAAASGAQNAKTAGERAAVERWYSSSASSDVDETLRAGPSKRKVVVPPRKRVRPNGATFAELPAGRIAQRAPRAAFSSLSATSEDESDDEALMPAGSKKLDARSKPAVCAAPAPAVRAKRKLPARAASLSSSSAVPSPAKKRRVVASPSEKVPAAKAKQTGKAPARAPQPPIRPKPLGSRHSARGASHPATRGGKEAGRKPRVGEVWHQRTATMSGKVWPVMILRANQNEVIFAVVPKSEAEANKTLAISRRSPAVALAALVREPESVLLSAAQTKALGAANALLADSARKQAWLYRARMELEVEKSEEEGGSTSGSGSGSGSATEEDSE